MAKMLTTVATDNVKKTRSPPKVGASETPRCQYSSFEKFEDAFDTVLDLMQTKPSNFDKCRPEEAGDVMSGVALDYVGTDVRASFSGPRLNNGRIINSLSSRIRLAHVCPVFGVILQSTGSSQSRNFRQVCEADCLR